MNFPLDFVWIKDNIIVDVSENVPLFKDGQVARIWPKDSADKILEINAGEVKECKIMVGDKI